jgi:hypothetical protein
VNTERHCLTQGCSGEIGGQPLLVHCVSGLVHDSEETRSKIAALRPPGDAYITVAESGGERVCRRVESAAVEVISDGSCNRGAEGELGSLRE